MTREEALKVAKPILFNTDMVRAILSGRKTVTRRTVKHNVDSILNSPYHKEHPEVEDKTIIEKLCIPPYAEGDILYVRETWTLEEFYDDEALVKFKAGGEKELDYDTEGEICRKLYKFADDRWIPSIHMPKEAARIFLRVTDVRVERLQDITEEQAKAEGAKQCYEQVNTIENCPVTYLAEDGKGYYVLGFKNIWESTIKKQDLNKYGWNENPWVWVIEFERIEVE